MFADNISFAAHDPQTAQQALQAIDQVLALLGLAIAPAKCEILEVNGRAKPALIKLNNTAIPLSTEGWKLLSIVFGWAVGLVVVGLAMAGIVLSSWLYVVVVLA